MQQGVISLKQLEAVGLSASGVRSRVERSRMFRVRPGVFALAPTLPPLGPVAAALLTCGPRAWACHLTGAAIHDLRRDRRVLIDVAMWSPRGRGHDGLVMHSARRLRPWDVAVVGGIPVTSVARTLLDCAPIVGRRGMEELIQKADWNGSFDLRAVHDLMAHVPGHRGVATLRAALGDAAGARGVTASRYEGEVLSALRAAGAREPECNPPIGIGGGDFAYPEHSRPHRQLSLGPAARPRAQACSRHRDDAVLRRRSRRS